MVIIDLHITGSLRLGGQAANAAIDTHYYFLGTRKTSRDMSCGSPKTCEQFVKVNSSSDAGLYSAVS